MTDMATVIEFRPAVDEPDDPEVQSYMTLSFEGEMAKVFSERFELYKKAGLGRPALVAAMEVMNLITIEEVPVVAVAAETEGYAVVELMPPLFPRRS